MSESLEALPEYFINLTTKGTGMIQLRYGYIANLICCIFMSIVLGAAFSSLTRHFIIQDITYSNSIAINYEFIKNPGTLSLSTFDQEGNLGTTHNLPQNKTHTSAEAVINIPFVYSHQVTLSFSPDENLVAIHKLLVNGEDIDLKDITHIFSLSRGISAAYSHDFQALIIHNQTKTNQLTFDDSFNRLIKLTRSEMTDLEKIFYISKKIYLLLCIVVFTCLTTYTMNYLTRKKMAVIFYALVLCTTLIGIGMAFIKVNYQNIRILNDGHFWSNVSLVAQNSIPSAYAVIILPLILLCIFENRIVKLLFLLAVLLSTGAIALDNFFLFNFHSHFIISEIPETVDAVKYILLFIENYLSTSSGWYMMLTLVLIGISCSICWRGLINVGNVTITVAIVLGIIMLGWGLYPAPSFYRDYRFNNVFQVNGLSENIQGDYSRSFSKTYEPLKQFELKWQNSSGNKSHKNVILVVLESLDCSLTFSCGLNDNLLPQLESLSKTALTFDNYYSNAYNSSGTYLSIIKSLPYLPSRNLLNDPSQTNLPGLYQENDLIERLRAEGYKSRLISATPLLFNMDRYTTMSPWNQIIAGEETNFPEVKNRYAFGSVSDEDLYQKVRKLMETENSPFFYYISTASTLPPNVTPVSRFNFENSFEYADKKLAEFIAHLQQSGYFANGVVVITGNHHNWNNPKATEAPDNLLDPHRIPLIILDGRTTGTVNHTHFSHSSLGVLIQSMVLDTYRKNQLNADPLNSDKSEVIFHYEYEKPNNVLVSKDDKTAEIIVNGNKTVFLEHVFTSEEEKEMLGFLAFCHD